MLNVLLTVLLLIYFWYFYYSDSKPLPTPKIAGPELATPFQLTYNRLGDEEFELLVNGTFAWNPKVPSYFVTTTKDGIQIQEIDECYQTQNDQNIPAKGLSLYNFVKKYPKFQSVVQIPRKEDYGRICQHGTPFYFTCKGKRIVNLILCPQGSIFKNGSCKTISSCTNEPDNKRLPHPDPHYWIQCQGGEEQVKQCPPGEVFYGGACTSKTESLCLLQKDLDFFKFDDHTLFGCQNHRPIYKACPPGTRLFDSTVCEPDSCYGKADGTKIPVRKRKRNPFEYIPGYSVCRQGKIAKTVECPQIWDTMLAEQEDLTMLPMVFHTPSSECSVPSLCENVWPTENDIFVRTHDYTRALQNWIYSKFYDQGKGYQCDAHGQKVSDYIPLGNRINDHFKMVPVCNEHDPQLLPAAGYVDSYYDCTQQTIFQRCPPNQFFSGTTCKPMPEKRDGPVFKYTSATPLFQFNSLNSEGWIQPLTKRSATPDMHCDRGYEYSKLYHICSHPLCMPYAFLSMIPELSLFLPRSEQAKCVYEEGKRYLHKESTPLNYTFWDQRVRHEKETIATETCTFGQHLKTGNYIWDKTLYATCDEIHPFVFCPSVHTRQIYPNTYACAPPPATKLRHAITSDFVNYGMNQFKRVLRVNNKSTQVQLNKASPWKEVPVDGLEIPSNTRLNLKALDEVDLEYKYRVTYPPNVVIEYTDTGRVIRPESPTKVFNVKTEQFEHGKFDFPRYRLVNYVDGFNDKYNP